MSERDEPTTTIDGKKVIHRFMVFHHEWECDGWGWVTEDGRLWLSTHGRVYEAVPSELVEHIKKLSTTIGDTVEAIRLNAQGGADREGETA